MWGIRCSPPSFRQNHNGDNVVEFSLADSRLRSFFALGKKRGWFVERQSTPLRTTFIGGHTSGVLFSIDLTEGKANVSEPPCTKVKGVDVEGFVHIAVDAKGEKERLALLDMLERCGIKPNEKSPGIVESDITFRPIYLKKSQTVKDEVHGPRAGRSCDGNTFKRKPGKGARPRKRFLGMSRQTLNARSEN